MLALVAESELRLAKREQAQQAAALRTAKANAAAIEKLLKDARKQVTELETELKRLTPVGRLIKWARQGSISDIYFENRLAAMGYPKDIIAKYWQEVIKDGIIPPRVTKSKANGTSAGPPAPSPVQPAPVPSEPGASSPPAEPATGTTPTAPER